MESITGIGTGGDGVGVQEVPVQKIDIEAEFQVIRTEVLADPLMRGHTLHEIMEIVAKKVVPLLTKTYPNSGETLERYVVLRDEIHRRFKEREVSIGLSPEKPLTMTQRIHLLLVRVRKSEREGAVSIQHFPPSQEQ